ncbi:MAG: hypothetical protein ACU83V_03165, partial [Gammaproteobacteria bacterium]
MPYKKNKYISIMLALTSVLVVTVSQPVAANVWSSASSMELIKSACPTGPEQYQELSQLKREITAADTVMQARTMALAPTDDAIGALKNARSIMPFSDDLRSAETRLSDA